MALDVMTSCTLGNVTGNTLATFSEWVPEGYPVKPLCGDQKIVSRRRAAKEFLEKFLPRELSVLLSLHHRNIIKVYEIVQTEDLVCIMMEYASRGDLLDYIKKHGVLREDQAGILFLQVCEGVHYLHNHNICHRDLKCENILLRRNMTIALSDFGFSRAHLRQDTLSSTFCGSAAYASPELLRGTPYNPFQNDIWSLGCVIFIMVTGQMPFSDKNTKKMMYRQLKGKVNFPEHRTVSVNCRRLISCTLEPNTDLRYNIQAVLSHSWLQHFAHLGDVPFRSETEEITRNEESKHSTTQQSMPVQETMEETFISSNSQVKKTATEQKDILKESSCNLLQKNSSNYSNDSVNDNSYLSVNGNTSLCRMPGQACIIGGTKKCRFLSKNENETSENDHQTKNISSTNNDQRVPSELSLGTNPSNSILRSSASTDHSTLSHMRLPVFNIYQNSHQQISRESALRNEDKITDENFQIKVQQIFHPPVSKTSNSMSFQDQLATPSNNFKSHAITKGLSGSQSSYNSMNIDLTLSVSVTQMRQSQTQNTTQKFKFQTSESGSDIKQFKHDVNVERANVYQAGLVTKMRRIFEPKNTASRINESSQME